MKFWLRYLTVLVPVQKARQSVLSPGKKVNFWNHKHSVFFFSFIFHLTCSSYVFSISPYFPFSIFHLLLHNNFEELINHAMENLMSDAVFSYYSEITFKKALLTKIKLRRTLKILFLGKESQISYILKKQSSNHSRCFPNLGI